MSDDNPIFIYRYEDTPADVQRNREYWLETYPPWRAPLETDPSIFRDQADIPKLTDNSVRRGKTYVSSVVNQATTRGEDEEDSQEDDVNDAPATEEELINLALILRRPLLVTGLPGVGKSTLAYHIAWKLGLGEPLRWEINSRTTLRDGLYEYRAVEHLRDIQRLRDGDKQPPTHDYVTLGPLGTAFVPSELPRVLLIDELDKAQFDLPNDLLHILEEAKFSVKELLTERECEVYPHDYQGGDKESALGKIKVRRGTIRAYRHPVVVITSNGDRPFPPAFLRRCVQLELREPEGEQLKALLHAQLRDAKVLSRDEVPVANEELYQALDELPSQSPEGEALKDVVSAHRRAQQTKLFSDSTAFDRAIEDVINEDHLGGQRLPSDLHIQRLFARAAFGISTSVTDHAMNRNKR